MAEVRSQVDCIHDVLPFLPTDGKAQSWLAMQNGPLKCFWKRNGLLKGTFLDLRRVYRALEKPLLLGFQSISCETGPALLIFIQQFLGLHEPQ